MKTIKYVTLMTVSVVILFGALALAGYSNRAPEPTPVPDIHVHVTHPLPTQVGTDAPHPAVTEEEAIRRNNVRILNEMAYDGELMWRAAAHDYRVKKRVEGNAFIQQINDINKQNGRKRWEPTTKLPYPY